MSYHLSELAVIQDPSNPKRIVPTCAGKSWKVLDVGCGIGQTLIAPEFADCAERHGIDIDADAISAGRLQFPDLTLSVASAEDTHYADVYLDLVFSRVTIPHTKMPYALQELHRVLKPGGKVWLTLLSFHTERPQLMSTFRHVRFRSVLDRTCVLLNSTLLQIAGRCAVRPCNGTYEALQFPSGFRRLLIKSGFTDFCVDGPQQLLATARKS